MNVLKSCLHAGIRNIGRSNCALLHNQPHLPMWMNTFVRNQSKVASPVSQICIDPNEVSREDHEISDEIISKINTQIKEKSHSRLFAVVKLGGFRFKITNEDMIALNTYTQFKTGERIRLEKVLLVGSADFTLLGRPLLHKDLVRVEATVIEETFITPRPLYRHGLHYRRLHWFRTPYTLLRINSIDFDHTLDDLPDVEMNNRVIHNPLI